MFKAVNSMFFQFFPKHAIPALLCLLAFGMTAIKPLPAQEPISEFDAAQNRFTTIPIDLGAESDQVFLAIFGSGIRNRGAQSSVIAYLGGVLSEVDFSGAHATYAGVDQINVRIPRTLAARGEVEVLLTVEAKFANPARINIK